MNTLNNNGKLNSEERIGFFDIKAIQARLEALVRGNYLECDHGYYGKIYITLNPQKNNLFYILDKDTFNLPEPEEFILWGYGNNWREVNPRTLIAEARIKELEEELSELKRKVISDQ